jgi:prepilin peptidase CpaA
MMSIAPFILLPLAATAAASDIRSRRVSNRLNLAILIVGLGWRAAIATATADPMFALAAFAGIAVGLAMLFVPFAARWVGAGDVKLLAACGAWLGPTDAFLAGLFGLFGGGILAAAIAATGGATLRRSVVRTVSASFVTLTSPMPPRRSLHQVVPLAVPIAAAAVAILLARGV